MSVHNHVRAPAHLDRRYLRQLAAWPLCWLLAGFVVLAWAYGAVIPPFEGPDEAEHFGVTRYVADTGRLPVQGSPDLEDYHVRQEASQPPLYYLVIGPLLRLSGLSTLEAAAHLQPNPYVTCGTETIRSNKATLRHNPLAEAFPWHGTLLALHLLRMLSGLLQALTVAGVYAIARHAFPDRAGVPLLAAALTAFNPQFLIMAGTINNDNIVTPLATWALYVAALAAQQGLSTRRGLALGVLTGLAALAKLTGLLLLPLAGLVVAFCFWRERQWRPAAAFLLLVGALAGAIAGWWYVRNALLYGDPTGLTPMLAIVGRRQVVALGLMLAELGLVFRSYWGQFPCAFFDSVAYYGAWGIVVACGAGGAAWGLWRDRPADGANRRLAIAPYVLLAWLGLVLAGWLRWNLTTPAPGGRLLFTATGATATLLAYGLTYAWPGHKTWPGRAGAILLAGVGLLALPVWIYPLFAPPALQATVHPAQPLQAQFGTGIELLGYDVHARALGPGRPLDVTLYWRARRPMALDYTLALQLVAPAPGDTRVLLNMNTWPGNGNWPTSAWPAGPGSGQLIGIDRYRLHLPLDTGVSQAWRLQIVLYDARDGTRLPLTLDGRPAGEALGLGTWRVAGSSVASLPERTRLPIPITFDQAIALTHAQVDASAGDLRVRLVWKSLRPLSRDLTVFVHAYDAGGKLVATGDGPPLGDNFATSLWQPGDQVLDDHALPLPASSGDVRVTVGLYQPADGARLSARQGEIRLPNDEAAVWPDQP